MSFGNNRKIISEFDFATFSYTVAQVSLGVIGNAV